VTERDPGVMVPTALCPHCGYGFDRASVAEGEKKEPRPGDISMCISCGGFLVFTDDIRVRKIEERDWQELDAEAMATLLNMSLAWEIMRDTIGTPDDKKGGHA